MNKAFKKMLSTEDNGVSKEVIKRIVDDQSIERLHDKTLTNATIQDAMNVVAVNKGNVQVIFADTTYFLAYLQSLLAIQRINNDDYEEEVVKSFEIDDARVEVVVRTIPNRSFNWLTYYCVGKVIEVVLVDHLPPRTMLFVTDGDVERLIAG